MNTLNVSELIEKILIPMVLIFLGLSTGIFDLGVLDLYQVILIHINDIIVLILGIAFYGIEYLLDLFGEEDFILTAKQDTLVDNIKTGIGIMLCIIIIVL